MGGGCVLGCALSGDGGGLNALSGGVGLAGRGEHIYNADNSADTLKDFYKAIHDSGYLLPGVTILLQGVGNILDTVADTLNTAPTLAQRIESVYAGKPPLFVRSYNRLNILTLVFRYGVIHIGQHLAQFADFGGKLVKAHTPYFQPVLTARKGVNFVYLFLHRRNIHPALQGLTFGLQSGNNGLYGLHLIRARFLLQGVVVAYRLIKLFDSIKRGNIGGFLKRGQGLIPFLFKPLQVVNAFLD